jgi:hypothetical protein
VLACYQARLLAVARFAGTRLICGGADPGFGIRGNASEAFRRSQPARRGSEPRSRTDPLGTVRPGDYLRMDRIAVAVNVSNTPVREGLLILRAQGWVRLLPRRGFVVAPYAKQDVRDVFWAQAVLAGELAANAAKRITCLRGE